ncbi:MAG: glycoside hydrolase family 30 protein [Candidatus Izemoplasma sp.]|nr:glycoside hydrolase family 30 protein [Candidatus Izemoplasma sp.]
MIVQYQTTKDHLWQIIEKENKLYRNQKSLVVDSSTTFQTMLGFGGAFTEAAGYTFAQLSKENQDKVLKAYFDPVVGLGYNLGRVSIHSCDFSLDNYTYVEDNDTELKTFDIKRDHDYVIPFIEKAEKVAGKQMKLLASPWSPPPWMKTNGEMNNGGKLKEEYFQTWADYFVKFIDSYRSIDKNIFAVTVQNEPAAKQIWDSCLYTKEEERDFVKNYLGPTLKKAYPDIHIIIWDHNRDIIVERADAILSDEEAREYVWGTGLHWYVSEEFEKVGKVHELHPDKHILFTEGCIEGGVHLGAWHTGERYARNMIGDFNNYCEGYIDWNLILNEIGGPNHVGNYCDAPIIGDTKEDTIHFNSSYYYIGHFSKFIQPGAKRIKHTFDDNDLVTVSFINPDKRIVTVVLNETEEEKEITLKMDTEEQVVTLAPRSISTFIKE